MIATFFEWQVAQENEAAFQSAWAEVTRRLKDRGSSGSTLFRNAEGHYCALARWPDAATRDAGFALEADTSASKRLRGLVIATVQRIDLDELENLWVD